MVNSSGRRGAAAVSCDADWSFTGEILITRPPHKVRGEYPAQVLSEFAPPRGPFRRRAATDHGA
jgi:hypothetical protein